MPPKPDRTKRIQGAIASVLVLGLLFALLAFSGGWQAPRPAHTIRKPIAATPYLELRIHCDLPHGMKQFAAIQKGMRFHDVTKIMRLNLLTKRLDQYTDNKFRIDLVTVFFRDPKGTILQVDFNRDKVQNKSLFHSPEEEDLKSQAADVVLKYLPNKR